MDIKNLTREEKLQLIALHEEKEERQLYNFCDTLFTDEGLNSRDRYRKYVDFMDAGAEYPIRCLLGGNQLGKTTVIGREIEAHATGNYPSWWKGHKFKGPVKIWIVSKDNKQMIDAAQKMMLGEVGNFGTGMLRKKDIEKTFIAPGTAGGVARILVKYKGSSERCSTIIFKSNQQDMSSFMGDTIDFLWADEEIKSNILGECRMRLVARRGLEVHTFTPLDGFTDVVKSFLPDMKFPDEKWCKENRTFVTQITWEDCPHFSEERIKQMLAGLRPHEREARSRGIPCISEGRIYDIPESECVVSPFEIPAHWPKIYALDVGWKVTAVTWAAYDKQNDTWYITDEYYGAQAQPEIHAAAIRRKCVWNMPGIIDPAANRTNEKDGSQLAELYVELGLNLDFANNALVSGIAKVYDRLATGRLKFFRNCQNLLQEYRLYKYDANQPGKPARLQQDHALDCVRYIINTGEYYMQETPDLDENPFGNFVFDTVTDSRDDLTGY